jgi:hypothetical protein
MSTMAQPQESGSAPPDERRDDTERSHRWLVHGLTALAAVLLLFTAANTWVKRQMLDTDRWVATSEELLADDEIRAALAQYVVDQLYASVDVQAQLEGRLPEDLDGLAGPIASGLRGPAVEAVDRLRVHRRSARDLVACQPTRPRDDDGHPPRRDPPRRLHG